MDSFLAALIVLTALTALTVFAALIAFAAAVDAVAIVAVDAVAIVAVDAVAIVAVAVEEDVAAEDAAAVDNFRMNYLRRIAPAKIAGGFSL